MRQARRRPPVVGATWMVALLMLGSCSSSPRVGPSPASGTSGAHRITAAVDWGSAGRLEPLAATDELAGMVPVERLAAMIDQRPAVREVLLGRYTGGDNGPPAPGRLAYAIVLDPTTCIHTEVALPGGRTSTADPAPTPPFCVGVYDARSGEALVGIFKP